MTRRWPTAVFVVAVVLSAPGSPVPVRAAATTYDHRVVVATTSLDRELDVDASLERNVNRLGAIGYELTALTGGEGAVIDRLLARRSYQAGLVDHSGVTFAVMARAVGQAAVARDYRIVHVRTGFGLDRVIAPLGAAGYRMTVSAHDGEIVHLAFERTAGQMPVEHRVFRNRFRRSWMDQALADPDARLRLTHVVPVALDTAVVELGPPQATPADMKWLTKSAHQFEALEAPLEDLARAGYRVQLVRARLQALDVLVVKPAGAVAAPADYDLDDGPWGMACGAGALAGADVMPDGDVACVTDRSGAAVTVGGLDLTLREQPSAGGQVLFRGPDCDLRARLTSDRAAAPRVALATQFEREINRAIPAGARVVRALAARDGNGQMRIVALTSDALPVSAAGPAVTAAPPPPLVPDVDGVGDDLARQREERLNTALAADARFAGRPLWFELGGRTGRGEAHLLGCVRLTVERELAAAAARGLLVNQGLADLRLDNRVLIDR